MSVKKQYFKERNICKVSFQLPKDIATSAKKAYVVGDFNNWDTDATPMKRIKNGIFTATLELGSGREYQFRYFLDNTTWETDFNADKFKPTPYGNSENSVIVV